MKKFISMVMAAAMVVSLVPATAFAYEATATAKVLDAAEMTEAQAKTAKTSGLDALSGVDMPELQIKITDATVTEADKAATATSPVEYEFDLDLSGAEWDGFNPDDETVAPDALSVIKIFDDSISGADKEVKSKVDFAFDDVDKNEATVTIKMWGGQVLEEDDKIVIDLSKVKVTKYSAGSEAKITVKSDDLGLKAEDMVFAVVQDNVLTIEADDTVDVAVEEQVVLEDITIEAKTGNLPCKAAGDGVYDLKVKLSKGFEFVKVAKGNAVEVKDAKATVVKIDGDEMFLKLANDATSKIVIQKLKIEADTANVGDVATLKVSANDWDSASVEVATVVGEGLTIEVDEDEDVPEMWSGVAVTNDVLSDDDDNHAKTITIKETVVGAYSKKEEVELKVTEGVIVTDVTVAHNNSENNDGWTELDFVDAYKEGDHKNFVFEKRTIEETAEKEYDMDVTFEIIAVPGFVGDVTVEMLVDGESAGEVVIATFKTPLTVEAQSNDLKIDYRNTEVGTDIVVKEAEAGLWEKGFNVSFAIDKFGEDSFEDDAVYTTNEDDSDMTVEEYDKESALGFEVDDESDEEAGVVTISNISLYMQRNIPAGAYDLTMNYKGAKEFYSTIVFGADCATYAHTDDPVAVCRDCKVELDADNELVAKHDTNCDEECFVLDVYDVEDTVKEGFVNIVTAGREQDDASFTTKVVVPVGESYIVAGEATITLDVPAYVSAAGYTMLPVRAVATALGINNNNVLWDAATKTVTILYGQRIITMQVGSKVINVNGSAIPASASVEIVNGRTFLPMRDLATALGVTDITWDAATKTATLNGNV